MRKKLKSSIPRLLCCFKKQCPKHRRKPCWLVGTLPPPAGVNIHGHFLSEIGLGETARLVYDALATQKIGVSACNRPLQSRENDLRFSKNLQNNASYSISLSIDGLIGFRSLADEICSNKYNLAYPFWELETFPKESLNHLSRFNRILAPSSFIFQNLKRHGVSNIDLVKHPISTSPNPPNFSISAQTLRILFFFDFDSFSTRKNPEATVKAFQMAFKKNKDVSLTIKTRGNKDTGRRAWLASEASADPRINVIDKTLDREAMSSLMKGHDVFLSLHRSEGLGLGCAEALAAGKAVVATDYGGSTDFISEATGFPVQWQRTPLQRNDYALSEGATWADPFVEHAAAQLTRIYDDPGGAARKAENGFRHISEHHSLEVIGARIVSILEREGLLTKESNLNPAHACAHANGYA